MVFPHVVERRRRIAGLVDLSRGRGLEVGPLDAPLAPRDTVPNVSYVDVVDREGLIAHYAGEPLVEGQHIPEIDYVLTTSDRVQTLGEAVRAGAPFDWVLASHVIEHVPDVIGWLTDLADAMSDDAELVLIVPDRQFTFDFHRHQTTVGQMLEAHDLGQTRPSVRAVYDNFHNACAIDSTEAWAGVVPEAESRYHPLSDVLDRLERARSGEYVDSHVWTFTAGAFLDQVVELGRLGLSDLVVEQLVPTEVGGIEFYAVLRRVPRGTPASEVLARHERAASTLADASGRIYPGTSRPEVLYVAARIGALEATVDELRAEIVALTGSRRWRVGGLVTVPGGRVLRAVTPRARALVRRTLPQRASRS